MTTRIYTLIRKDYRGGDEESPRYEVLPGQYTSETEAVEHAKDWVTDVSTDVLVYEGEVGYGDLHLLGTVLLAPLYNRY
jgi:hypothetical protein